MKVKPIFAESQSSSLLYTLSQMPEEDSVEFIMENGVNAIYINGGSLYRSTAQVIYNGTTITGSAYFDSVRYDVNCVPAMKVITGTKTPGINFRYSCSQNSINHVFIALDGNTIVEQVGNYYLYANERIPNNNTHVLEQMALQTNGLYGIYLTTKNNNYYFNSQDLGGYQYSHGVATPSFSPAIYYGSSTGITYSVSSMPTGMTFNSANRTFNVAGLLPEGTYYIRVEAYVSGGGTKYAIMKITVLSPM